MIRACERIIGLKPPTSRFGGENESSSGFKSPGSAQRFLPIHAAVQNAFYIQRHLLPRSIFKKFRAERFDVWRLSCAAV